MTFETMSTRNFLTNRAAETVSLYVFRNYYNGKNINQHIFLRLFYKRMIFHHVEELLPAKIRILNFLHDRNIISRFLRIGIIVSERGEES